MASVSKPSFRERKWESRGSIKSSWQLSFFVLDGQDRRRVERSGYATKRAAEAAFRDLAREVMEGTFEKPTPTVPTLGNFIERYLSECESHKRPKSIELDRLAFTSFLRHVPESLPLDKVTEEHADSFVSARLKEAPRIKNGRERVSEYTVKRELVAVRRLFNLAKRWGIVSRNPTDGTRKPVPPEGDVVFLEVAEQRALLLACREIDSHSAARLGIDARHNCSQDTPYLRPLVAVALYAGLRAAEIFNLTWQDVDFERRRLIVRNTAHFQTKTKRNRQLELHPGLADELQRWKQWFTTEIDRAISRSEDRSLTLQLRLKAEHRVAILQRCEPRADRLIFPSFRSIHDATAEALPRDNVKNALKRAAAEAGLKRRIGLHTLRHTFAVTLARQGVPLTKISSALGHSNLKTTQIYLRFMPDEGADVTSRIPYLGATAESATPEPKEPSAAAATLARHSGKQR